MELSGGNRLPSISEYVSITILPSVYEILQQFYLHLRYPLVCLKSFALFLIFDCFVFLLSAKLKFDKTTGKRYKGVCRNASHPPTRYVKELLKLINSSSVRPDWSTERQLQLSIVLGFVPIFSIDASTSPWPRIHADRSSYTIFVVCPSSWPL